MTLSNIILIEAYTIGYLCKENNVRISTDFIVWKRNNLKPVFTVLYQC